jgi:hypothetical protein
MRSLLVLTLCLGCSGDDGGDPQPVQACKVSDSADCTEAANHADLAWIEANVFLKQCAFSGCHNGTATAAGRIDMKTPGASHAALVDIRSHIDPAFKLVVPGQPKQSYLLMMLRKYKPEEMDPPMTPPPDDVGFMPQNANGAVVCCQKLDAIERWITAGAANN